MSLLGLLEGAFSFYSLYHFIILCVRNFMTCCWHERSEGKQKGDKRSRTFSDIGNKILRGQSYEHHKWMGGTVLYKRPQEINRIIHFVMLDLLKIKI